MKINNSIAAFYQPGMQQPQAQPRLQQDDPKRQETLDAIASARKLAATLDTEEYDRVRSRVEREQEDHVVPDSLNRYARNAVGAYDSVAHSEERDYSSEILGVDLYA